MRFLACLGRLSAVLLAIAIHGPAFGQSSNFYIFGGVGGASSARYGTQRIDMGGLGYERVFRKTFGLAGEVGAMGTANDGFVMLSLNGSYHLARGSAGKLDPFVTAGYSLAASEGSANLFNFGGGVYWWFRPRWGLRVEVRDHVGRFSAPWHYWGLRIGLGFR